MLQIFMVAERKSYENSHLSDGIPFTLLDVEPSVDEMDRWLRGIVEWEEWGKLTSLFMFSLLMCKTTKNHNHLHDYIILYIVPVHP